MFMKNPKTKEMGDQTTLRKRVTPEGGARIEGERRSHQGAI